MNNIGRAIRTLRVLSGVTITVLANKSDISQPYLTQVEMGTRHTNFARVARIAKALDVSLDHLVQVADFLEGKTGNQVKSWLVKSIIREVDKNGL